MIIFILIPLFDISLNVAGARVVLTQKNCRSTLTLRAIKIYIPFDRFFTIGVFCGMCLGDRLIALSSARFFAGVHGIDEICLRVKSGLSTLVLAIRLYFAGLRLSMKILLTYYYYSPGSSAAFLFSLYSFFLRNTFNFKILLLYNNVS